MTDGKEAADLRAEADACDYAHRMFQWAFRIHDDPAVKNYWFGWICAAFEATYERRQEIIRAIRES